MPDDMLQIDPESLLREAISAVAVNAFSRGINVVAHIDNRLPCRVKPRDPEAAAFLRRGLTRTVESGNTAKIVLALWLEEVGADGSVRAMVEVCRALQPGEAPVARLADLWALPLEGATARPRPRREDDTGESVLIPLHLSTKPGTAPVADRWGGIFRGCRLLDARDVLVDPDRLSASLVATGAEFEIAQTAERALETLMARAAEGRPFDAVAVEARSTGARAVAFAKRARAEPALAGLRIVLANAPREGTLAADDLALFDAASSAAAPRRRILDVLSRLFRKEKEGPDGGPVSPGGGTGAARPAEAATIPQLRGRRILVAEDVATNQMLLEALLAPTGARLEAVNEGASALRRHREDPADLILMDLQMPGTSGIEALLQIRALGGPVGSVPIVALTAYAREADRRMALEAGMDAYLAKPIVVAEFYALLSRLLPPEDG